MPKLPDLSRGPVSTVQQRGINIASQQAGSYGVQSARAIASGLGKVADAAHKVHTSEEEKRDSLQALEADNAVEKGLTELEAELERDTNYDMHEAVYGARSAQIIDSALAGVSNKELAGRLRERYAGKVIGRQDRVRAGAERGKNDNMVAALNQNWSDRKDLMGSVNTPRGNIPGMLDKQLAELRYLRDNRTISAVEFQRQQEQAIADSALVAAKRLVVEESPEAAEAYIKDYMAARKAGNLRQDIKPPTMSGNRIERDEVTRIMSPKDFFGPGVNVDELPLGMRESNNPGNLKYSGSPFQRKQYYGMMGPSKARDQGDPQILFSNPLAGMASAAKLALVKNTQGNLRSVRQLITDKNGWTPGFTSAAENIAKTMGVSVDRPLDLRDPDMMKRFMRALITQEHGPAGKLYDDKLVSDGVDIALGVKPPEVKSEPLPPVAKDAGAPEEVKVPANVAEAHRIFGRLSDVQLEELRSKIHKEISKKKSDREVLDKANLNGIVKRIRETGSISEADKAAIDGVKSYNPKLYAEFDLAREEAVYYAEGQQIIKADPNEPDGRRAVPLEEMTPEELTDHVERLQKHANRPEASGREVLARTNALNDIKAKIKKIQDQRKTDPGASVARDPAVMAATDRLDRFGITVVSGEGPDQAGEQMPPALGQLPEQLSLEAQQTYTRDMFEKRKEAQIKVGITPEEASYVTLAQAKRLLVHSKGGGTEAEFEKKLEDAYQTALEWTGDEKMAGQIVADAYKIQVKGEREERKSKVAAIAERGNDALTPAQKRRLQEVQYNADLLDFSGLEKGKIPETPAPTGAAIEWLKANISDPKAVAAFRRTFGDAALANSLMETPEAPKPMEGVDRWGRPAKSSSSWW